MKFEHFALNVPDSSRMADWYVRNCGMTIVHSMDKEPFTRFLADMTGRVVAEFYSNKSAPIPDYAKNPPECFHFAFAVANAMTTRAKLEAAGATFVEERRPADGSLLLMLRDPWGVALQLCQRTKPFIQI